MDRVLAQEDGELLAAVDAQLDHSVLAELALQDLGQALGSYREGDGGELFAVGNRRDLAFLAQPTSRALAGQVANFCFELDDLHGGLQKFLRRRASSPSRCCGFCGSPRRATGRWRSA